MISISVSEAQRAIDKAIGDYGTDKVHSAIRMALNDGARRSRTEVTKGITALYNIKRSRILDSSRKKGLSISFANNNFLTAELFAGHIPINLSETKVTTSWAYSRFKDGTKARFASKGKRKGRISRRSTSLITVEIIKGQPKLLDTAFIPGVATNKATGLQFATPAIFARGKRGFPNFNFSTDTKRYPIDTLATVSVHTASINAKTQGLYVGKVNEYTVERLMKNLGRLGGNG